MILKQCATESPGGLIRPWIDGPAQRGSDSAGLRWDLTFSEPLLEEPGRRQMREAPVWWPAPRDD